MSDASAFPTGPVGKGGNVCFTIGKGKPDGSFLFYLADGTEYLRIDGDGKAFIKSKLVASDPLVYFAFRDWLRCAGMTFGKGERGGEDASFTPHS